MNKEQRQAVRDLILRENLAGGISKRHAAHLMLKSAIPDEADREKFALAGAMREVEVAFKENDSDGLPYFMLKKPKKAKADTEETEQQWGARQFLLLPDYEHNIAIRTQGLRADHRSLLKLQAECRERFGRAPAIPMFEDENISPPPRRGKSRREATPPPA